MEISRVKELAKKASDGVLFDAIYYKQFSDDELVVFKDEVKTRGLEANLAAEIKSKELNKSKIKAAVKGLSRENLLSIVIYNTQKFTEEELMLFKNEVRARGLDGDLTEQIKIKKASDLEFKETVLDAAADPMELIEKFNAYNDKKYSHLAARADQRQIRKMNSKSYRDMILGVVLLVAGGALTAAMEGGVIFYGAILVGFLMLVRGIVIMVKS